MKRSIILSITTLALLTGVVAAGTFLNKPTQNQARTCSAPRYPVAEGIPYVNSHPYELTFSVSKDELGKDVIVLEMTLRNGAHFVSPQSEGSFKGRFLVDLARNEYVELTGVFTETPNAKETEVPDFLVNSLGTWVTVNTTYTYALNIKSTEDFEAFGYVQFVIEPRCTMETTPYVLSQHNGELSIRINEDGC